MTAEPLTIVRAAATGRWRRWAEPALVAAVVLLAVAVRVHHLGKEPLWNDEGFTWWAIGQSWHDLWTLVPLGDPHPPFYYSLLKLWTALAGQSEAGLRGLSVLFAAATVPVVYLAGRTLGGARDGAWTGAAAALLFALSPLHLHYAQEARPYAGLTFAASLAFAGALWLVLHPGPARRPLLGWGRGVAADEPSARPAWLALVVGTALALWCHNLGVYLPAALGLALLAWLARDLRWDRSAFANLALAGALVLLAWSPWWPWLVRQTRDVGEAWYLAFPTWAGVLKVLSSLFGLGYSIPTRLFEAGLAASLVGIVATGRRVGLTAALLLGLGMVVPVALSLLVSRLFQPVFLERTLVWASLPFYLALAGILPVLPARLPRLAAMALAVWFAAQGAFRYDAKYRKEPWDRVVATIGGELQPGDLVLVMPNYTILMVDYYERKLGIRLPTLPLPSDGAALDRYGQGARDRRRCRAAAGTPPGRAQRLGDVPADGRRRAGGRPSSGPPAERPPPTPRRSPLRQDDVALPLRAGSTGRRAGRTGLGDSGCSPSSVGATFNCARTRREGRTMKPIVTLTVNPAIDAFCLADEVVPVRKVRTREEHYVPGGGGINVARAVKRAGRRDRGLLHGRRPDRPGARGHDRAPRHRRRAGADRRGDPGQPPVYETSTGQEYRFTPEGRRSPRPSGSTSSRCSR